MSQWTHVAGIIRVDALPGFGNPPEDLKRIWGNTCTYDSPSNEWNACSVPKGSEGSVQYRIEHTGNEHELAWGVVYIWGDLRNYDDAEAIYRWVWACVEKMASALYLVRQCSVQIDVEGKDRLMLYDVHNESGLVEIAKKSI